MLLASIVTLTATGIAQHTVVRNNGVGGRIETDYNAAGGAAEIRTIGADGKLQQKVNYEYQPGYYVPQETDTTYWPNGKVRRIAHNTYDESANFTGEFIQVFDESGKQIGGHKLTHDPWTGVYHCADWNADAQDYRSIECPAGEESEGAKETKKLTRAEIMKDLQAAHANALREEKMRTESSSAAGTNKGRPEVGIIFPKHVRTGERVSGSVVENPDQYRGMEDVTITRVAVPFAPNGESARLSGWLFETAGEEPRRADGPVTLIVPRRGSGVEVTLREARNDSHFITETLTFPELSEKKSSAPTPYQAPAVCMKSELCVVSGTFNGDSGKTFAAFEDRPAKIVAETSEALYLGIPDLTATGSRPLFIEEGRRVLSFAAVVVDFFIKNNGRELQAGEKLITFPTLDGAADIPESSWRLGTVPAATVRHAQELVPGFQPSHGRELEEQDPAETEEKQEKDEGEILLVIRNVMPEQIRLRSSKDQMLIFHLGHQAFSHGEFKYDLVVEAEKAGKIDVRGYVVPLLAPLAGEEFSVNNAEQ